MKTNLLGIDIGSTTAKVVLIANGKDLLFSAYERHNIRTAETLIILLHEVIEKHGDIPVKAVFSGSAGMGPRRTNSSALCARSHCRKCCCKQPISRNKKPA